MKNKFKSTTIVFVMLGIFAFASFAFGQTWSLLTGQPYIYTNSYYSFGNINTFWDGGVEISRPAGKDRFYNLERGSALRWSIGLVNSEGGSNTGSDFALYRYADNSGYLGTALTVNRANGNVTITGGVSAASATVTGTVLAGTLMSTVLDPGPSRYLTIGNGSVAIGVSSKGNWVIDGILQAGQLTALNGVSGSYTLLKSGGGTYTFTFTSGILTSVK
jgi:hypothetical protein